MSITYLSYDPNNGFEEVEDRQEALDDAEEALDLCRDEAPEGWPDDVQSIFAAVVVPISVVEEELIAQRGDYDSDEAWEEAGYSRDHQYHADYYLKPVNAGLLAIIEERRRQLKKGWTPAHDAEHDANQLLNAAICKLAVASFGIQTATELFLNQWPWENDFGGDTSDPKKLLVEAAALIWAELDRLAAKTPSP